MSRNYQVLARRRSRLFGDDDAYTKAQSVMPTIFSVAEAGVGKGLEYGASKKAAEAAAKKSAEDSARGTAALNAAVAADNAATTALAQSLSSAASGAPSAAADKMAADMALQAQDQAAAGLSPEGQAKRAEKAKAGLARAVAALQGAKTPGDRKAKEFWVQAAQATYGKTQNAQIRSAQLDRPADGEGFLTRKVLGPIPGWGVLAGAAAVLAGGIALAVRFGR